MYSRRPKKPVYILWRGESSADPDERSGSGELDFYWMCPCAQTRKKGNYDDSDENDAGGSIGQAHRVQELSYPREYGPNGSTLYLRSRSDYNVLPHKCGGWAVPDMGAMGISERAWEGGVAMSRYAFSRDRASRPWPTAAVTGHPLGGGASKSAAGGRMDISREIANGMATMSRLRIITDVTGWNSSEQGRVEPNPACFSGDGTNERCPTLEETVSRTRHTNSTIVHGTINPAGQHRLDDP